MNLVVLQTKTLKEFDKNLENIESLILECEKDSFILAPELALTGYSYENMAKAATFSLKALERLLKLSITYTISLTLLIKENDKYFNKLFVLSKGKVIHTQNKFHLFELNDEGKYFSKTTSDEIKIFEVEGLKVAALICFELRFIELWKKLQGADIILVPALWGVKRKDNYETLTKALAITNQCFVMASSSASKDAALGSSIITPSGVSNTNDKKELLENDFNKKDILQIREHLPIGIN